MEIADVIIVGAGAAGLMAAYKLSEQGKKVIVLEARNRTGGRIHTIENELFFKHAELGAEFVHGDLPVTLNLLKEAGIPYSPAGGEMVNYANGKFKQDGAFIEQWDLLLERLNELQEDISMINFLDTHFPEDKYKTLRTAVIRYVSGYDTADPDKASSLALRKEWANEDEDAQHRIDTGYCSMIKYLADECKANGGNVYLNSIVKQIDWRQSDVKVITDGGIIYGTKQIIIAMPLGVLQADENEAGAITFHPAIAEQTEAIKSLGFGAIIKFLLEFDEAFWENDTANKLAGRNLKDMAFLLSDEEIPTWWTQHPQQSNVLTGWLGGPPAELKKTASNEELLQQALASLSNIFKLNVEELKAKLIASAIVNWTAEQFTLGSYSYDTIAAPNARKVLMQPVEDIIFFAGEYLYDGPAIGTVEAALTSGDKVAKIILS